MMNQKRNTDEAEPCGSFPRAIYEYAKYLNALKF